MNIKKGVNLSYHNCSLVNDFVNNLPYIFDTKGDVIFKKRNCIKRFILNLDNGSNEFIVKRFKKPNFIQKIVYSFFKKTKAKRAFENSRQLRARNIDTPLEIAYLEVWNSGLFCDGYYVSLADYSQPIAGMLSDRINFDKDLANAFAKFSATLHQKGILHHDLNSTNVLYKTIENNYHFSVIDINRMKFYPLGEKIPISVCYDNMTRFCGNMNLYKYVLEAYISYRELPNFKEELSKAIEIKKKHDSAWDRRKRFTRLFKCRKNKKFS